MNVWLMWASRMVVRSVWGGGRNSCHFPFRKSLIQEYLFDFYNSIQISKLVIISVLQMDIVNTYFIVKITFFKNVYFTDWLEASLEFQMLPRTTFSNLCSEELRGVDVRYEILSIAVSDIEPQMMTYIHVYPLSCCS